MPDFKINKLRKITLDFKMVANKIWFEIELVTVELLLSSENVVEDWVVGWVGGFVNIVVDARVEAVVGSGAVSSLCEQHNNIFADTIFELKD